MGSGTEEEHGSSSADIAGSASAGATEGQSPAGWVLVPREPTDAMNDAGYRERFRVDSVDLTYRAMLSAAPTAPTTARAADPVAWRPIATAPRDGTWFIGLRAATRDLVPLCAMGCYNPQGEFEESSANSQPLGRGFYPTHWMPHTVARSPAGSRTPPGRVCQHRWEREGGVGICRGCGEVETADNREAECPRIYGPANTLAPAELLTRVEWASGPDRELDGRLHLALSRGPGGERQRELVDAEFARRTPSEREFFILRASDWQAPKYTSSLDAALALAERLGWRPYTCDASIPDRCSWTLQSVALDETGCPDFATAVATTPALAVCAALLAAAEAASAPSSGAPPVSPSEAATALSTDGLPSS